MRWLTAFLAAGWSLVIPAAAAEPHDCAAASRARGEIAQMPQDNGVAVRQSAIARNRATAVLLRTAAADTSDAAVRGSLLAAASAAERYADVMAAATSVDGVLAPPGEVLAHAVNTLAALERLCPSR